MPPRVDRLSGSELQGWRLGELLGNGADGVVYAAEGNSCTVAIKIFFPENLQKEEWSGARERLELQLSLKGEKHHPNLVAVIDGGELEEYSTIYLVMEYVPGKSLDKMCGEVPPEAVPQLAQQLASACQWLEERGLVHRDIKPANIVISEDFKQLTLLDLGVIHWLPTDEGGRLSGDEFVATTRYSPPEFVWRTEEAEPEGWRAVTFYQIGATLHDMIMGVPLFSGNDKPRARLYDSVRERTPEIQSAAVPAWLVEVAQACLLKDWRQRTKLLTWESFTAPEDGADLDHQVRRVRVRQLRQEEKLREKSQREAPPTEAREQALWLLNSALIHELRTYVIGSDILPRCAITEVHVDGSYLSVFSFDEDDARFFPANVAISFRLSVDKVVAEASSLAVAISVGGKDLRAWSWTELFTVDVALTRCQQALVDAVEVVMNSEGS